MQTLNELHQFKPLWAVDNQLGLWDAKISNLWLPFGGISAMPSIHVAMATVFALVAWKTNVAFGILFVAYVVAIQIGSVILGWHYAVDGYVSMILTLALWKIVDRGIERYCNLPL
jgi:membrane-associated phospholipid phosphatase